jgi:hypothetical protein
VTPSPLGTATAPLIGAANGRLGELSATQPLTLPVTTSSGLQVAVIWIDSPGPIDGPAICCTLTSNFCLGAVGASEDSVICDLIGALTSLSAPEDYYLHNFHYFLNS